jgi:hypothetical protein
MKWWKVAVAFFAACMMFVRAGAEPRGGDAEAVLQVSRDSLESMVKFLSVDPTTSALRTRFALREEPLSLIADSLASRLEQYLHTSAVRMPFTFSGGSLAPDSIFSNDNIMAYLAGSGDIDGVFLVTAHYDAVSSRVADWNEIWQTHPAPGADDNATGVAALLEVARALSAYELLPFDISFILFSAEENGLVGSGDYTEKMTPTEMDEVIGVFNMDMIGYAAQGSSPGVMVVSNVRSGWLADIALASLHTFDPTLSTILMKPGLVQYDHKSFWDVGINAITFSEPFDEYDRVINPYYHTAMDTMGWIDFEQVERVTAALTNLIGELSAAPAELTMMQSDLILYWKGSVTSIRAFDVGDTLTVQARPRNIGSEPVPPGTSLRLDVSVENRHGTEMLYSEWLEPPSPFRCVTVDIPLILDERHIGGNVIRVDIDVDGMEDEPSNNEALETFGVEGGTEVILGHYFQPNPIPGPFGSARFCINLAAEAELKVEIFDLEGELVGRAFLGYASGIPLGAGLNCLDCRSIFPAVGSLVSGVYPYRIVLFDQGRPVKSCTGLFAVEN